jgi:hypothetical protein
MSDTASKLLALRGKHDQTARCEAIKIIVEHHYGPLRMDRDEVSDTEAFITLMADKYGEE